jgi:hypothetical protein
MNESSTLRWKALQDTSVLTERRTIAITDQKALLNLDIREVLTDRVEVVDEGNFVLHAILSRRATC